jgi:hypothetical protein
MTKKEAEKLVQKKLAEAQAILDEVGLIADEHQLTVRFLDKLYAPRGHKYDNDEAADGNDPFGFYFQGDSIAQYEKYYAGTWLSSNEYRGC